MIGPDLRRWKNAQGTPLLGCLGGCEVEGPPYLLQGLTPTAEVEGAPPTCRSKRRLLAYTLKSRGKMASGIVRLDSMDKEVCVSVESVLLLKNTFSASQSSYLASPD